VIRTNYPHWGQHAGFHQFLAHLDPARFAADMHVASDGDDDFPIRNAAVRTLFRALARGGGMAWYGLSDLVAEWRAFRQSNSGSTDILHYLDGEHSAQFVPMLRRLSPRTQMIATYHQPARVLPGLVRRSALDALDAITVVSPEQRSFFERHVSARRVHTILHGVDTSFFTPGEATAGHSETFECITVGHYLRDFATLQDAIGRLADDRDIRFHIVTNRDTGLEALRSVTLHRNVSDSELLALYQRANLLLLPLTDCTANNALLEGMACGLPVLTTDLESVRVYAPGEEAMLIEAGDADALADAIAALRDAPARRRTMGGAARLRAESLAWPAIARQFEVLYQSLL
jgi:glycosyltransferase involved in cell wall biosynthesis